MPVESEPVHCLRLMVYTFDSHRVHLSLSRKGRMSVREETSTLCAGEREKRKKESTSLAKIVERVAASIWQWNVSVREEAAKRQR